MSLEKTANVAQVETVVQTNKTVSAIKQLHKQGIEIKAGLSPEVLATLGKSSTKIKFVNMLGLASRTSDKVGAGKQHTPSFVPVGLRIEAMSTVEIPVIPCRKDTQKMGVDVPTELTYRTLKKGEKADITLFEFMYLVSNPEYAGCISTEGNAKGLFLKVRADQFVIGKVKLPSPSANFPIGHGSPKDTMLPIDEQLTDKTWVMKAEYQEKFGELLARKSSASRATKGSKKYDPTESVSLALSKLLYKVQK